MKEIYLIIAVIVLFFFVYLIGDNNGFRRAERGYLQSSLENQEKSTLDNEKAKKLFTKNDRFTKLSSICEK